jgi:Mor family transcriptional regulator
MEARGMPTLFNPNSMEISQVIDGLDHDLRSETRCWPTLLAELVDVVADHMQTRERLGTEAAIVKAQDVVLAISHYLGGRAVYLPRNDKIKQAIRDNSIYRAWMAGATHAELARKMGLTTARIYSIISAQRQLRRGR